MYNSSKYSFEVVTCILEMVGKKKKQFMKNVALFVLCVSSLRRGNVALFVKGENSSFSLSKLNEKKTGGRESLICRVAIFFHTAFSYYLHLPFTSSCSVCRLMLELI